MRLYKILGCNPQSTYEQLKRGWKEAAKKYHPDITLLPLDVATPLMQDVNNAWEVLGDADKRRAYDAELAAGANEDEPIVNQGMYNSAEIKAQDNLIQYCKKFNVSKTMALRIWNIYGLSSLWQIKNNPFACIAADKEFTLTHAEKLGGHIPFGDERRLKAYLLIVIKDLLNGDTYIELDKLKKAYKPTISKKLDNYYYGLIKKNPQDKSRLQKEQRERVGNLDIDKSLEIVGDALIIDGDKVQSRLLYDSEMVLARLALEVALVAPDGQVHDYIPNYLNDKQGATVLNAHHYKYSTLTGGPGTGKTETIKSIVNSFKTLWGDRIIIGETQRGDTRKRTIGRTLIICPTGKAAKRARELTGHKAITAHMFILSPRYIDVAYSLKCLIIDEASMLDVFLAARIVRFMNRVNPNCHIVFAGDPFQLKSVDAGAVLRDLEQILPNSKLITNYRQGAGSVILENAEKIGQGDTDLILQDGVFERVNCVDFFDAYAHIAALENIHDWTIITPMNGTNWGVKALNFFSQKWHNPQVMDGHDTTIKSKMGVFSIVPTKRSKATEVVYNRWKNKGDIVVTRGEFTSKRGSKLIKNQIGKITTTTKKTITCEFITAETMPDEKIKTQTVTFDLKEFEAHVMYQKVLRVGDKVMCTKNEPMGKRKDLEPLVNGDVGIVESVTSTTAKCRFNGELYTLKNSRFNNDLDNVELAYAYTCHKMQGDETDNIIIVLPNNWYTDRWWLKTAVTRAKKRVVVLDNDCLETVIQRQNPERKTRTIELLQGVRDNIELSLD